MKSFYVLILILGLAGLAVGQNCTRDEFQCDNGKCVSWSAVCNRRDDCGDGDTSDEPADCGRCNKAQFECGTGLCLEAYVVCNGRDECNDNSDEVDPVTGQCPACPDPLFHCNNGRCVYYRSICDGVDSCGDRSDEPENPDDCPACSDDQFRCKNGKCTRGADTCDGFNDCQDWSDESEEECPCADSEVRCPTPPSDEPRKPRSCIPKELVCDEEGIWDCPDGWDEANCTVSIRDQQ